MSDTPETWSQYNAFLDTTLKTAIDEHKLLLVDLDNIHTGILKQYLWLSALLVGAFASLIGFDQPHLSTIDTLQAIYTAGLTAAAAVAIYAFIRNSPTLIRICGIKNATASASNRHLPLLLDHLTTDQSSRGLAASVGNALQA